MIQDKVRTSSYASYILTNSELFQDAVVLDVGCGTGILSLFAAKSGAKRVFAIDASDISKKAKQIVQANGYEDVITCVLEDKWDSRAVAYGTLGSSKAKSKTSNFLTVYPTLT
jgi:ribosomal protein L11 methylase PrmA